MTRSEQIAEEWADVIAEAVELATAPLARRIERLEQRPAVAYRGVFSPGTRYAEGSLCTRQGALWIAKTGTQSVPGTPEGANSWQMIVKSGGAS